MSETKNGAAISEGRIPVTGGSVWFRTAGANRPGIPLLAVHGGPGATHDYLEPLEALADERPVIFYDQLDCGASDRTDDPALWTVERYTGELGQVCRALKLEQVYLLGQSWGTVPVVEHVLRTRGRGVAGIILSGPMLNSERWSADQRGHIALLPPELRRVIRETEASGDFDSPAYQDAMMEYYRRHVCRLPEWPECLNRCFSRVNPRLYLHMWGPSEFTVTGTLRDYDCTGRLPEIAAPTLLTCGSEDEAAPATVRAYQDRIPGAEFHLFADASHEHHLEKPEEYGSVVRDFLRRADRAAGADSP